jgi:hypothetical protein
MATNKTTRKRSQVTTRTTKFKGSQSKRFIIFFVALFAAIGVYALLQANAAPKTTPAVTLSISPASQRLSVGQVVGLSVKLNTNGQAVNAVQANLSYPSDKFDFDRIDGVGSAFEIEAEAINSSGLVKIARGSVSSVNSSDAQVATVYLRAKANGRKVKVSFADGSLVIRTSDAMDILSRKTGGSYTIQ